MHRGPAARWRGIALLAAIVGAGASAYLLVEYVTGQPGVCLTGTGCDLVRSSAFAYPLGIPLPLIGLAFYLVAGALVLRTIDDRPIVGMTPVLALQLAAAAGAAASLVLTGIEAFVIKAFCSWCLVQAAAAIVLFGAALLLSRGGASEPADRRSSRARHQVARAVEEDRASLQRTGLFGGGATALGVAALLAVGALGGAAVEPVDGSDLSPASAPRTGTGAVEVVEFADFQCPGCAAFAPTLAQMAANGEITLVARHFPLDSIHPNADAAARAAAAAHLQDAYWPMSDALYASQATWKDLDPATRDAYFATLAGQLGLDTDAWAADFASSAVADAVDADREVARDLNLNSTPTLFVGGDLYRGPLSATELRAAIAEAAATQ